MHWVCCALGFTFYLKCSNPRNMEINFNRKEWKIFVKITHVKLNKSCNITQESKKVKAILWIQNERYMEWCICASFANVIWELWVLHQKYNFFFLLNCELWTGGIVEKLMVCIKYLKSKTEIYFILYELFLK